MSKRYVLFSASHPLTEQDMATLQGMLAQRRMAAKVIPVKGNPGALIVKTTNAEVLEVRELGNSARLGGKTLVSVSTSGAIGNLKKRASGATAIGEIPQ